MAQTSHPPAGPASEVAPGPGCGLPHPVYAVANLDDPGQGPGFRKVRGELGVTVFGINAIVLPQGHTTNRHWHDRQEEVCFVHRGRARIAFGDGTSHVLEPGGLAATSAATAARRTPPRRSRRAPRAPGRATAPS
ncbi:cupin domain-containing protein [Baekduia soli]|uniref:Cupin domain-containing protein n=1 Tax=Baekduia soli TaxID=496014 RepID=A0A5B8U302_9ACTN|nr:cupin domain-containing protein [Baekduia soli]